MKTLREIYEIETGDSVDNGDHYLNHYVEWLETNVSKHLEHRDIIISNLLDETVELRQLLRAVSEGYEKEWHVNVINLKLIKALNAVTNYFNLEKTRRGDH